MDLAQFKHLEKRGIKMAIVHELKTAKTLIETKKNDWEKEMAERKKLM